ncbi:MAG: HTTM domain-containing protein, partial [Bdellovibrionales bacterium]
IFAGILILLYSQRFLNLEFYNEKSILPDGRELELIDSALRPLWSWHWWPDSWAFFANLAFIGLCFLILIGKAPRPVALMAWFLHMGFMHRNWAAGMGVDTMVSVFLFYLSFVDLKANRGGDLLSRVMIRMSQVHLSVIYFYTGIEKFRGVSWWEGTALWTTFSNPQMTLFDLSWTHHFPLMIAVLTHVTVLFELMFLPLVWNSRTRFLILAMGLFFHLGIALFLGLWAFAAVMLVQYVLFLNNQVAKGESKDQLL